VKAIEHFRVQRQFRENWAINFWCNWSQFEDDPRTENLVLHLGPTVDYRKLDPNNINVHMWGEWPNGWFGGRTRGQCVPHNEEIERRFDYVATFCHMTMDARKEFGNYVFVPHVMEPEYMNEQLGFKMEAVQKDIDVFMCAGSGKSSNDPRFNIISSWHNAFNDLKQYKTVWANQDIKAHYVPEWNILQSLSSRSKISVVFAAFIAGTPQCREFTKKKFPWLKWKSKKNATDDEIKEKNHDYEHNLMHLPAAKPRILDAAFSKSLILCWKDAFAEEDYPYRSAIESVYKLIPDVDFIYFENSADLRSKICEVLEDFDNPKYQNMIDSAYKKINNLCSIENIYENYLVPMAENGKTIKKK
jgi:hypothetical protein